ncbi:MAG: hypothetical protein Q8M71_07775 [Thermodesulfovibrionales bacterium]|nr:hypothetical protein [Thermodesulfovibrionales bacterium]
MPKVTFEIPADIKDILTKHSEIDWDKIISDTLWNYAKKIKLLESITAKSRLTAKDVEVLDHEIKAALSKKYQNA